MKKTQQLSSLRESSMDELSARVKRVEEELFQNRLKRYTNQLENTNLIRSVRREIARCRTILSARTRGSEQAQAKQPTAEGEK